MYTPVNKSKENSSPTTREEIRAVANSATQKKSDVKQGVGFVDNRPKMQLIENTPKVMIQKREEVAQMQSKIDYGPLYDMKAGAYNIKVGSKVDAHLDPSKPLVGSDTSGFSGWGKSFIGDMKNLTGDSWVAGHLINHDLGGRGLLHNFFPITKKANSLHLHEVEYPIKGWISDGHEVNYSVNAWKKEAATSPNPSGYFDCIAEVVKPSFGKKKPGKIHKQIQSLTEFNDGKRAQYAYFKDNEITERGRRGVPSTWKHESGGKEDREYESKFGTGSWWMKNDSSKLSSDNFEYGSFEDLSDEHESL